MILWKEWKRLVWLTESLVVADCARRSFVVVFGLCWDLLACNVKSDEKAFYAPFNS